MGRPSKLTAESQARIVQAIELGATYEHAANFGGVSYAAFRQWMIKGEAANAGKYRKFFDTIKEAEHNAIIKWLAKIEKAASGNSWQAAAWKLERRYPEKYGRQKIDVEHSGQVGWAQFLEQAAVADDDSDDTDS